MPKALPWIETTAPIKCLSIASSVPGERDALEIAVRLKALADPSRLRILGLIIAGRELGARTCDLASSLSVAEPTVSHHLKQLRRAGLVIGTRSGGSVFYRPEPEALSALCRILDPGGN